MTAEVALLAACWFHAGFQAVVSLLVYPGFAIAEAAAWPRVHRAHTRGVTPLVVVAYGGLVVTAVMALLAGPSPAVVVAVAAAAVAILVTALLAVPLHGRLSSGRPPEVLRRLLVVDRVRLVAALVAAIAALVAVF